MTQVNAQKIEKKISNAMLSEIVIYNGVVYLAGQVPDDDTLDIAGQARQVFANIDKMLAEAGSAKAKLLTAQVFIRDLADFAAFNNEWSVWIADVLPPTRATVQANLVNPNWRVEIVVTAAV